MKGTLLNVQNDVFAIDSCAFSNCKSEMPALQTRAQFLGKEGTITMISYYNTYGKVNLTGNFFSELVATTVQSGYGVAGMSLGRTTDQIKYIARPNAPGKGVRVVEQDNKLNIEIHIKVTYGLNIKAAVKSITHKVKYIVEETTGLEVNRIDVAVDDVIDMD